MGTGSFEDDYLRQCIYLLIYVVLNLFLRCFILNTLFKQQLNDYFLLARLESVSLLCGVNERMNFPGKYIFDVMKQTDLSNIGVSTWVHNSKRENYVVFQWSFTDFA